MARRVKCVDCGNWCSAGKAGSSKFPKHVGGCPIDARRAAALTERERHIAAEVAEDAITVREHRAAVLRGDLLA